jgi:hypothetical protein
MIIMRWRFNDRGKATKGMGVPYTSLHNLLTVIEEANQRIWVSETRQALGSQYVLFWANFRILAKDSFSFFFSSMTPNLQIMGKKVSEFIIFGQ